MQIKESMNFSRLKILRMSLYASAWESLVPGYLVCNTIAGNIIFCPKIISPIGLIGKPKNSVSLNCIMKNLKGLSVNEDYNYLWAVHSFDVETFEFSVVLFLLLSSECGVNFNWGQARVNFDSSPFWNCIFTTEKNCGAGISNSNINDFLWTTGNQM